MTSPVSQASTADLLSQMFRSFVSEVSSSPLYMALCPLLADDPVAMDIMGLAQPMQRRPNLMLAALHCSLLGDSAHPLAAWFPTVGGTAKPTDPGLGTALRSFVADRTAELIALVDTGATQTNEPGRSAVLFPVLADVAHRAGKPLAMVDVGASAGLNLRLDHYQYTYDTGSGDLRFGPESSVRIRSDVSRSQSALPSGAMRQLCIGHRVGVDLNPLDVHDAQQALWLQALVWPDEPVRHARLAAALDLARHVPVTMVAGDAVDAVEQLVLNVPAGLHPVVTTTWVLTYLPPDRRRAFVDAISRIGAERPMSWVFMEHPVYAAELPYPDDVRSTQFVEQTPVVVADVDETGMRSQLVAVTHPHGTWFDWCGVVE